MNLNLVNWIYSVLRLFFASATTPFTRMVQDTHTFLQDVTRDEEGNDEEEQYLDLVQYILERGEDETTRNGNTRCTFGATLAFSLQGGRMPLLTTKRVAWKTALRELLWMIRGQTHNRRLQEQGVHIWDGNSSREFLDQHGFEDYEEGEMGPIYGWQMRRFNAPYVPEKLQGVSIDFEEKNSEEGVDQLQYVINLLKNPETRHSRRIVMSLWNPCQLKEMALPPCHCFIQFHVSHNNQLSCALTMRSNDVFLGQPFNIAGYCFLTHLLAKHCGLEAHEFILFAGNCHIYHDHFDAVKRQLLRKPLPFPTLQITTQREHIEEYEVDDFVLSNYQHHPAIYAPMAP